MSTRVAILSLSMGTFLLTSSVEPARAQSGSGFALENGDTNGDLQRNLSDAVRVLGHLFLGSPAPVPLADCGAGPALVRNGDTNGDGRLDLSDGIRFLNWLYAGGTEPAPACAQGFGADRNPNPRVIPPNAIAYGKSYGDWGAAWWQWAVSIPAAQNPVVDATGEFCDVGQEGPVWFLAGNFGGATERACTVPAGKSLFFPLLNFVLWAPEDLEFLKSVGVTGESDFDILLTGARTLVDATTELSCTVDGIELEDLFEYRGESSEAFSITLSDIFEPDFPAGVREPCASDGFWVMLAPLSPGEHEIVFSSALSCTGDNCFGLEFDFGVEVTYHLTVE